MNFRPRHLLIRWLLPVTWKLDESQKTRVLQEFAQTELDSAWQSIYAFERVESKELRAMLFMHAFEELFHSDLFASLAKSTASSTPLVPLTRRVPLMPLEGGNRKDAVEFFAFLAIGESEIQRDFGVYERAIPDPEVSKLFSKIYKDEQHHAQDSAAALDRLTCEAGISLKRIRLRHLGALCFKRYVSVMGKFGTIPMTALLFVAYALFGGIFSRQARERLSLMGDAQLEFLKRQQQEFDAGLKGHP